MADIPADSASSAFYATPPTGWFVALAGPPHAIQRLTQLDLQSFAVVEQEKWTCLKSPLFEQLADHNAVLNCAEQIAIPRMRGLATLLDTGRSFASVSAEGNVFRYDDNGNRDGRCFISGEAHMSTTATVSVDASGGSPAPPDPFPAQADAAASIAEVDQVLALFGALDQANWTFNTYKILEHIRYDIGKQYAQQGTKRFVKSGAKKIELLGWLTADEIDSLRSVHDPNIVGTSARHAVQEEDPPNHPIRQSSEAITILRKLIKHWIQHKSSQQTIVSAQLSPQLTP